MKPVNLAKARILVTNDDGIHAPGLDALIEIADQLSSDVWVVAPEVNQSGAGHSLSLSRPIRMREVSERKYALEGTPTDCVLFAAQHLLKDRKPDIVLSGVNRGTNMADDVTYSGTIAAAMQAVGQGVPAVAVSIDSTVRDFAFAARFAAQFVEQIKRRSLPRGVMLSINIPTVKEKLKGVVAARMGGFPVEDLESEKTKEIPPSAYYRIKAPSANRPADEGSDTQRYLEGFITITPLRFDWTDFPALESLKAWDLRLPGAAW